MAEDYDGWKVIRELTGGGQAKVYLVRSPGVEGARTHAVESLLALIRNQTPPMIPADAIRGGEPLERYRRESLPAVIRDLARGDDGAQLGVLKVFNIPPPGDRDRDRAIRRLELEARALRARPITWATLDLYSDS